jgi:hypothetical protein
MGESRVIQVLDATVTVLRHAGGLRCTPCLREIQRAEDWPDVCGQQRGKWHDGRGADRFHQDLDDRSRQSVRDVKQLQVVVVGAGEPGPGCKITLDGKVVAEQPVGGSAHCVFDRD